MKWYDDDFDAIFAALAQSKTLVEACQLYESSTGKHLNGSSVTHAFGDRGWRPASYYLKDAARIATVWPRATAVPGAALRSRGSVEHAGGVGDAGEPIWVADIDAIVDRCKQPSQDPDTNIDGSIGVAHAAQPLLSEQQFTGREQGASAEHRQNGASADNSSRVSSSAACPLGNDTGWKRPLDEKRVVEQGVKQETSNNPRVNPALHVSQAPKGYHLRGVSTLLDGDGKPVQQWVKTGQDRDALNIELLFEAIKTLPDSFSAAHTTVKPPSHVTDDLLVLYPILDVHLGMLSWCEETGNSYDTHIAERLHVQAIKNLVDSAPRAKHAVVASLGDLLHVNDNDARTERSAKPLDTDSRFAKVLRVGVGIQRAMIDAALEKHEHVTAYFCVGNHDAQASLMLALGMELFYRNDQRVTICTSPAKFLYHRWGKCLFGFTHGDTVKSESLPGIMATDRAKDWGETVCRKFLVGHIHKERVLDLNGCKVEHYRTLAGLEAYAYNAGYRTDRGMSSEYYHREHGFIGNAYVPLSLLEVA